MNQIRPRLLFSAPLRVMGPAMLLLATGAAVAVEPTAQEHGNATEATEAADAGWTVPRTADGRPDLQGVWANNNATPLQRPEAWSGRETLTDKEVAEVRAAAAQATNGGEDALFGDQLILAAIEKTKGASYDPTTGNYNQFWVADRDFTNRTSLVVDPPDGRIPALTGDAAKRQAERAAHRREHPADSWEDRPLGERCVTFGVPRLGAGYNSYYQIFQNADHVVILMEMIHDARIIPIGARPHLDDGVRLWHGDPRAHWDGDTLVIETRNFSDEGGYRGSTGALTLTERLTRTGPESLEYAVTLDDPETWTAPWTASIPLKGTTDPIFEYACHEGNYGMEGILAGHRAEEREAAMSAPEAHVDR